MKPNIKQYCVNKARFAQFLLAPLIVAMIPVFAFAQIRFEIRNPLQFVTIEELLVGILNALIILATPIIVLFIIYAGFLYVTAQGNAEQIKQATRALTYAIIGAILIIGALAFAEIIKNLIMGL